MQSSHKLNITIIHPNNQQNTQQETIYSIAYALVHTLDDIVTFKQQQLNITIKFKCLL